MKDSSRFTKIGWAALLAAFALLAVPVAQGKPITFSSYQAPRQGESAQGIKADGLRLTALAQTYALDPAIARAVRDHAARAASSSPAPVSENSPVELRLQASAPVSAPASGSSFDWRDAGIGAGLAALLTSMLALGAGSVITRKRVSHA